MSHSHMDSRDRYRHPNGRTGRRGYARGEFAPTAYPPFLPGYEGDPLAGLSERAYYPYQHYHPLGQPLYAHDVLNPLGQNPNPWTGDGLNPALAENCTPYYVYDIRHSPQEYDTYVRYFDSPATRGNARHLRLISKRFPWTISVHPSTLKFVTCSDVWKALYSELQKPLSDAEWALADEEARTSFAESAGGRSTRVPQRMDWLGKSYIFLGLDKDDMFADKRLLPGREKCESTWVVKFAARCD